VSSAPTISVDSPSVEHTEQFAESLARRLPRGAPPFVIYLRGDLGAGKTVFARSVLRTLGVAGRIKSPTYTLLEPYPLGDSTYLHIDLYRLRDPAEVETLALRDYLDAGSIWLIEWPERAPTELPEPDLEIRLEYAIQHRVIHVRATSDAGVAVVVAMLAERGANKH
jgi:tRNA threonylcarbamoyladenosine biosynthesis protein TsaE